MRRNYLDIIVPTITGREDSLTRTLDAYRTTTEDCPLQVRTHAAKNFRNWPSACNNAFRATNLLERRGSDLVHFGADDLVPLPGWWKDATEWLDGNDELPAAFVYDFAPPSDGGKLNNAGDGKPGDLTHFTRVPIMTRDQWYAIGTWPEIDYYADVWLSEKARTLSIETRLIGTYEFVHYWNQHGRLDSPERMAVADREIARLREEMNR